MISKCWSQKQNPGFLSLNFLLPDQWFSNFSLYQNPQEDVLKHRLQGSSHQVSDPVKSPVGPEGLHV